MSKHTQQLVAFRAVVSEEIRNDMKARILAAEAQGYPELISTTTYILAQLVAGNIPQQVAAEARGYLELLLTAITAQKAVEKSEGGASFGSLASALKEAKKGARKLRTAAEITDFGEFATFDAGIAPEGERLVINAREK